MKPAIRLFWEEFSTCLLEFQKSVLLSIGRKLRRINTKAIPANVRSPWIEGAPALEPEMLTCNEWTLVVPVFSWRKSMDKTFSFINSFSRCVSGKIMVVCTVGELCWKRSSHVSILCYNYMNMCMSSGTPPYDHPVSTITYFSPNKS